MEIIHYILFIYFIFMNEHFIIVWFSWTNFYTWISWKENEQNITAKNDSPYISLQSVYIHGYNHRPSNTCCTDWKLKVIVTLFSHGNNFICQWWSRSIFGNYFTFMNLYFLVSSLYSILLMFHKHKENKLENTKISNSKYIHFCIL